MNCRIMMNCEPYNTFASIGSDHNIALAIRISLRNKKTLPLQVIHKYTQEYM